MNAVLVSRKKEIAEAIHGLCAAIGNLSEVRRDLEIASCGGLGENGLLALQVKRIQGYLISAALDVNDDMWRIMLSDDDVGGEELRTRVKIALGVMGAPLDEMPAQARVEYVAPEVPA